MLIKINEINTNPPKKFNGAYLENDITAFEIQHEVPERLNLRKDYNQLIDLSIFIKEVDKMMNYSYNYSQSDYYDLIDKIRKEIWNYDK